MKFRVAPAFERDFAQLPREHQEMFRKIVRSHLLPAIEAGSFTGQPPWPTRLRIHRLADESSIYSVTWSFAGPDGRATFHLESTEGEPVLVWRRIGTHDIYRSP